VIELSKDKDLIGPWVCNKANADWFPGGREVLGLVRNDEVLAGIIFENYTGPSITLHISVDNPHVPLKKLLIAASRYVFRQLGCYKAIATVPSPNNKSINFVTKFGFKLEAIIEGAVLGGDLLIFTLTEEEAGAAHESRKVA
jgi:hypothetical protein